MAKLNLKVLYDTENEQDSKFQKKYRFCPEIELGE